METTQHIDHDSSTRTGGGRLLRRAIVTAGLIGVAAIGPLSAVASAETPPFPGDGPVIVMPTPQPPPTVPPVVNPAIDPGPADLTNPQPDPDPDPHPDPTPHGPDDEVSPTDGPDPDPTPHDGPDDFTIGDVPPTTVPDPQPEPEPEPEVESADETAADDAPADSLAYTGGDAGTLALVGAGIAAAGLVTVAGTAAARRRRA